MKIAAVADIHSPRYLSEFKKALEKCERPDVFLLAGDMIDVGKIEEYSHISGAIIDRFGEELHVVACFGNDEKGIIQQSVQNIVEDRIMFLDGETVVISHNEGKLGILGVPLLDVTRNLWDRSIEDIFEKRIQHLARHLEELKMTCDRTILLLHYSPLSGEMYPETFSWWVSRTFKEAQPDLVVHGHIHYATKSYTMIGNTKVVNVAFPSTGKVTEILL